MKSNSKYAILGIVLKLKEASGYDIKKYIDTSLKSFWSESYGQIYPGLAKLKKKKFVEFKIIKSNSNPDKKIYNITNEGKEILQEWLVTESKNISSRNEFLFKLMLAAELSPLDNVALMLKKQSFQIENDIKELKQKSRNQENESNFVVRSFVELEIKQKKSIQKWNKELLSQIRNLQEKPVN